MKTIYFLLVPLMIIVIYSCKKSTGSGNSQTGSDYTVNTLAGNGIAGLVNGNKDTAEFNSPFAVASDAKGNVYVADQGNNCIRKIFDGVIVSTLAGSGVAGFADGTGTAAQFNGPQGVAVDRGGYIYVTDAGNNCIRMITPDGVVTTLTSLSPYLRQEGYADGPAASAQFAWPIGIAVDKQGNIFVADNANEVIRKITTSGNVITIAGSPGNSGFADGLTSSARFDNPQGLAVDFLGNVYVADVNNNRIRKITPYGKVTTLAGNSMVGHTDGIGTAATFAGPTGVATDYYGNIYVADATGQCIRKITPNQVVSTLAGSTLTIQGYVDGPGNLARFAFPTGIATDPEGEIFVADNINNRIRRIIP
jgi:NHL repeat